MIGKKDKARFTCLAAAQKRFDGVSVKPHYGRALKRESKPYNCDSGVIALRAVHE
jgi:hypothetical protein